jgi:hypothetical protein
VPTCLDLLKLEVLDLPVTSVVAKSEACSRAIPVGCSFETILSQKWSSSTVAIDLGDLPGQ